MNLPAPPGSLDQPGGLRFSRGLVSPLDERAVKRACRGAEVKAAHQLCRLELETFRRAAATGAPLTVACTQEAPLFSEVAEDADIRFVNIRETAGWSKDAKAAGPKNETDQCAGR